MSKNLRKLGRSLGLVIAFLIAFEGFVFLRWTFFSGREPSLLHDVQTGLGILICLWAVTKIGGWFEQREARDNETAARIRDIDTRVEALYKWGSLYSVDDGGNEDSHLEDELDDTTKAKIATYKKEIADGDPDHYGLGVTYWNLAMEHYNKHGMTGYRNAVYWLHKAAEQDYDCESTLADAYMKLQDYDRAMLWYRKSVKRGGSIVWIAERNIGDMYEEGKGVLQNFAEAARWWHRAAEHGSYWAHYDLGKLYAEGKDGVPQDRYKAYFHLFIASSDTSEHGAGNSAIKQRDEAEKRLGQYFASREKARAEEWLVAKKEITRQQTKNKVKPLPLPD